MFIGLVSELTKKITDTTLMKKISDIHFAGMVSVRL